MFNFIVSTVSDGDDRAMLLPWSGPVYTPGAAQDVSMQRLSDHNYLCRYQRNIHYGNHSTC